MTPTKNFHPVSGVCTTLSLWNYCVELESVAFQFKPIEVFSSLQFVLGVLNLFHQYFILLRLLCHANNFFKLPRLVVIISLLVALKEHIATNRYYELNND